MTLLFLRHWVTGLYLYADNHSIWSKFSQAAIKDKDGTSLSTFQDSLLQICTWKQDFKSITEQEIAENLKADVLMLIHQKVSGYLKSLNKMGF